MLDAAVRRRWPPSGLIFHSDQGSEYAATAFRDRLVTWGCVRAPRRPEDNAHMESFFRSLKVEVVHVVRFKTEAKLRHELLRYVLYYNHRRLHSALGYRSPVDYKSCAA